MSNYPLKWRAFKKDLGLTNSKVGDIIGNTRDSVQVGTGSKREFVRWAKLAIWVHEYYTKETMVEYKSLDSFYMVGRGTVFLVKNDKDRDSFSDMVGNSVLIDGCEYKIKGVEYHTSMNALNKGSKIGLLVKTN